MANLIRKKFAGVMIAMAIGITCLPFNGIPAAAAGADQLEEMVNSTPKDNFMRLAFLTLMTSSYIGAGYADDFLSEQNKEMLDVNASGEVEITDASLLLYWYSWQCANGTVSPEAEAFLDKWNTQEQTTTPVATMTTALTTAPAETGEVQTTPTSAVTDTVVLPVTTVAQTTATTPTTTTTTTKATTVTTTTKVTTVTTTTTKSYYNGLDVSKYQGNVDWTAVKKAGKDFAIIRAGYGKYASQEDPYFDQNMKNAQAAGIACGAYWFSYAETPADAKQEAEVFAQVISGYRFEYPLVFDIEATVHTQMTKEQASAVITAFCDTMESKGYYVTLYSYASFLNNQVYQSVLEKYDVWVAHFGVSSPSYSKTAYGMWQYSSTGTCSGISGAVDLDYGYRNYPTIMAKNQLNGY